jgi:hypothetical protein
MVCGMNNESCQPDGMNNKQPLNSSKIGFTNLLRPLFL